MENKSNRYIEFWEKKDDRVGVCFGGMDFKFRLSYIYEILRFGTCTFSFPKRTVENMYDKLVKKPKK